MIIGIMIGLSVGLLGASTVIEGLRDRLIESNLVKRNLMKQLREKLMDQRLGA